VSTHGSSRRTRAVAVLVAVVALVGACSSGSEPDPVPTPRGFDLPSGVTLTRPGAALALGRPGTAVVDLGDGAASAVTVVVRAVRKGSIRDFRFFSLDAQSRASTPYYVDVTVRNDGPAGLGGSSLPVLAHSDADVVYPASELVGEFEPCPSAALPGRFLPGSSARLCFVYLVPRDETVETIDLQPGDPQAALRWKAS
jgi:hypothetical protein